MLSQRTPEAVARHQQACKMLASAMTEAKQWVWEKFGEAMEKDFNLAPSSFWETIRHLGRENRGLPKLCAARVGHC